MATSETQSQYRAAYAEYAAFMDSHRGQDLTADEHEQMLDLYEAKERARMNDSRTQISLRKLTWRDA